MRDDWPVIALLLLILVPWALVGYLYERRASRLHIVDDWEMADWQSSYLDSFVCVN